MTNEEIKNITLESLRDWFKKEKWVRISSSGNIAGPCGTSKNKKNPDRCLPKAKAQSLTKGQRAATAAKKKKAGAKGKTVVKNTKKATVKKEGLWANINAKKKAGKKSSHKNSNAYKAAKKAGNALKQETKGAPAGHYFTKSGNLVKGRMTKDAKERGARLSDPKDKMRSKVPKVTQYAETSDPQDGKAAPYGSGYKKVTKEDIRNLIVGTIAEMKNEQMFIDDDEFSGEILVDKIKKGIKKEFGDKYSDSEIKLFQDSLMRDITQRGEYDGIETSYETGEYLEDFEEYIIDKRTLEEKDDRCTRLAKSKYDTWPSAYASGAVVRCRRGEIWKKK